MVNYMGYNASPYYYPQRQDNLQQYNSTQQGYRVIPVSNEQEANATQVDLSGNPIFFYNKGQNEVYIKQFNQLTGLADFQRFELTTKNVNESKKNEVDYAEKLNTIENKLDSLIATNKKVVKNDKSAVD